MTSKGKHWAIVLSGGSGERMQPLIEEWLGERRPKQYCTFVGTRSMLQHTLDRASEIVSPERILTVIGRGHGRFLVSGDGLDAPGPVIEQPENRGTAPGILLPATYIMAHDPEATVLIFPSDHFIFPEDRFLEHVMGAALAAQSLENRIILIGARAESAETDYGWIQPGRTLEPWNLSSRESIREVAGFLEKPRPEGAENFFSLGYFWNTMIMAVKAKTLWELGLRFLPQSTSRFESLRRIFQTASRIPVEKMPGQTAVSNLYRVMPSQNFSHDFLERATAHAAVLPLSDVHWSDWGRPARVMESLSRIGKCPLFQQNCATV